MSTIESLLSEAKVALDKCNEHSKTGEKDLAEAWWAQCKGIWEKIRVLEEKCPSCFQKKHEKGKECEFFGYPYFG